MPIILPSFLIRKFSSSLEKMELLVFMWEGTFAHQVLIRDASTPDVGPPHLQHHAQLLSDVEGWLRMVRVVQPADTSLALLWPHSPVHLPSLFLAARELVQWQLLRIVFFPGAPLLSSPLHPHSEESCSNDTGLTNFPN